MRVECYYTIEGKAVYDNFKHVGWKAIGVWVLSGDTLLFKFLPGNEEAIRRAERALIRADGYYGNVVLNLPPNSESQVFVIRRGW